MPFKMGVGWGLYVICDISVGFEVWQFLTNEDQQTYISFRVEFGSV